MAKSLYQKIKANGGNPFEAICNYIEKSAKSKKYKKSKESESKIESK